MPSFRAGLEYAKYAKSSDKLSLALPLTFLAISSLLLAAPLEAKATSLIFMVAMKSLVEYRDPCEYPFAAGCIHN